MRSYVLPFIILLVSLSSCSDSNDRILSEIESEISVDPARSFSLLDSVDYSGLTRGQKARYAVMTAQLEAILHYPVTNYERLDSALDYYRKRVFRDDRWLMMAAFYKAMYDYEASDYHGSITNALTALELAKEHKEYLWCGRIYTLLADISNETLNHQEWQKNSHLAAENYLKIDSLGHYQYAVIAEACAISDLGEPSKGLALIDSMYATVPYYSSTAEDCTNDQRAEMLRRSGRPQEAYKVWGKIPRSFWEGDIDCIVTFGNILIDVGKADSCEVLVDEVLSRGDSVEINHPDFLYLRYRLAQERGDYREALDHYVRSSSTLYDMVRTMMGNSAAKFQGEFYKEQSARRKQEYELRRKVYIGTTAAVILLALILVLRIRGKLKRRRAELESLKDEIIGLRDETSRMTAEIGDMQRRAESNVAVRDSLESLRSDLAANLSRIIQTFGESVDDKSKKQVAERLKELRAYLNGDTKYAGIERDLDCITGGLFGELRREVPRARETDIRAAMLQALGMTRRGIATYMGINALTLYSNLYRFRKTVRSAGWDRAEEFVALMRRGIDDEQPDEDL